MLRYRNRAAQLALPPAVALLGNEARGLAIDFINMQAYVRDRVTPANNFLGDPNDLLTYVSPSTKYVLNDAGVLVPSITLRCNYLVNTTPLGIPLEPQATNLCIYSEDFTTWSENGATPTPSATTAPDGNNTASLVMDIAGGPVSHVIWRTAGDSSGSVFARSIYVKKYADTRYVLIGPASGPTSSKNTWIFDLDAGVFTATGSGGTGQMSGIFPDGWFRLTFLNVSSNSNNNRFCVGPHPGPDYLAGGYTADGTLGVYVWGAQSETGSFATSYIKTEASQVTRAPDNLYLATDKIPYSAEASTLIIENSYSTTSGANNAVTLHDGTNNNRMALGRISSNVNVAFISNAGVTQMQGGGIAATTDYVRTAFAAAADDGAIVHNGVTFFADLGISMPAAATRLQIGNSAVTSGDSLNGHVRSLVYIPRRLSNGELQARSA
jgi:hypothetical protein